MKALTIWQPWATLLASGKKHIETRSRKINYRGEILIHAAKKPYIDGIALMNLEALEYLKKALNLPAVKIESDWTAYTNKLPSGVIIGKAVLTDCQQIDQEYEDFIKNICPAEYAFGDFTPGRYAWVMEDPVLFNNPIPARGSQGLWNWEGELSDATNKTV